MPIGHKYLKGVAEKLHPDSLCVYNFWDQIRNLRAVYKANDIICGVLPLWVEL